MGYFLFNKKGRLIVKLFNVVFSRWLVFIIGWLRIIGYDGVIIWNDIYYKIRMEGGLVRYIYLKCIVMIVIENIEILRFLVV